MSKEQRQTKHAPGPWVIQRDDRGFVEAIGPISWWAQYANDGGLAVDDADACLAAAAPDMLVALERILEDVAVPPEPGLMGTDADDANACRAQLYDCQEIAAEVIAKARGES